MTDRILEIGEAGLESTDQKVRKLMDNLVNSEVPGYKKSEAIVTGFPIAMDAATKKLNLTKPQVEDSFYNALQGSLVKTGNQLDCALGSDGFFVVAGPWGDGYTRDGRFQLDNEGRLLTVAGNFPVQGKMGPIVVTPGAQVEIDQTGAVKIDNVVVDQLQVSKPERQQDLDPLNGSIFKKKDSTSVIQDVDNPRVIQGYVETSNVNVIEQMMEMIYLERTYNLDTKIVATRDASLTRAMDLGKVQ
ncbi:MAG TPA: flagellar hook basal-body protein [Candidatus Sulfotelmatobacter sp.]|nr:flagellar hook basal-body protein [Candidatus Sulfotelmatobacter sp.]